MTRLRAGRSGVLIFTETRNLSLLLEIQSGAAVHPQRFFPERKAAGREADLSLPSRAEVQNEWSYTSICFLFLAQKPLVSQGLLINEVSRSHSTTHHSRYDSSGREISSSQRPLPDNTQHSQQTDPYPRWDSNPQSQQASGCRTMS